MIFDWIQNLIVSFFGLLTVRFGLGFVAAGGLIAAWWFIPPVPWFGDRLRLACLIAGVVLGAFTFGYGKGAIDMRASMKTKIQKEITREVQKGNSGAADALRKFDAGRVPDEWFRD